jgi:hypothetical protein
MKCGKTIVARLDEHLRATKEERELYVYNSRVADVDFHFVLRGFDKLSYAIESLQASLSSRTPDFRISLPALRAQAEGFAARVTYLAESLRLIELDTINAQLLVRSTKPQSDGSGVSFFEAVFHNRGQVHFCRNHVYGLNKAKAKIPFVLTVDLLERLCEDLALALYSAP